VAVGDASRNEDADGRRMRAKGREESGKRDEYLDARSEGSFRLRASRVARVLAFPREIYAEYCEIRDTAIGYYVAILSKSYEVANTRLYYPSRKHVEETGSHFA